MGAADSTLVLRKEDRFGDSAMLSITGRDVEEKNLKMRMIIAYVTGVPVLMLMLIFAFLSGSKKRKNSNRGEKDKRARY